MSKIGKLPVPIPSSVTVGIEKNKVTITGPKGELSLTLPPKIKAEVHDDQIFLSRLNNDKKTKSNHGTVRAHLNNMVSGVQQLWQKQLEIRGTGYKASVEGNKLILSVGYIHTVEILAPEGIQITVEAETKITVSGIDKTVVGQTASNIRKVRKPEPYQGKGVRYLDEYIKIKPGKAAKTES